jgi:hypothetical protein
MSADESGNGLENEWQNREGDKVVNMRLRNRLVGIYSKV